MSYSSKINEFIRKPLLLVEISEDECLKNCGVTCDATGTKCFKTFMTCKDKPNYEKGTKIRRYISKHASIADCALTKARRYLERMSKIPTEIREDKTVPGKATFKFIDEWDSDVDIDPYYNDRGYTGIYDAEGTYWKKWRARNEFYKGRNIVAKRGFPGMAPEDYKTIFSGIQKTFSRKSDEVSITANSKLEKLNTEKIPFEVGLKLAEDLPAFNKVSSEEEMLEFDDALLGDLCCRTDFENLIIYQTFGDAGSLTEGVTYYYKVIIYDNQDNPIAASSKISATIPEELPDGKVILSWEAVEGEAYAYVYGRTVNATTCKKTTTNGFTDPGGTYFNENMERPVEAFRIFKLTGENPLDINAWKKEFDPLTITLGIEGKEHLSAKGYFKIGDECCYYEYDDQLDNITKLTRSFYDTDSERKFAGTSVRLIPWFNISTPVSMLTQFLSTINLSDTINTDSFNTTEAKWNDAGKIAFLLKPFLSETKFSSLVADMMKISNCFIWNNENDEITVRLKDDYTIAGSIDDTNNILLDSTKSEDDEESRFSRIYISFDRKDLKTKSDFLRTHKSVLLDGESENEFNEQSILELETMFIDSDLGSDEYIKNYLDYAGNFLLKEHHLPPKKITFETDIRDEYEVGAMLLASTDEIVNPDGTPWQNETVQVMIKDDSDESKIKYIAIHRPTAEVETSHEINDNYILTEPQANLTGISNAGIEVTGLQVISGIDPTTGFIDSIIEIEYDNPYLMEDTRVFMKWGRHALLGQEAGGIYYPSKSVYKRMDYHEIWVCYLNKGCTAPAYKYPTDLETNGIWRLNQTNDDKHDETPGKKYKARIKDFPLGARVCIAVYAVPKPTWVETAIVYGEGQYTFHNGYLEGLFVDRVPLVDQQIMKNGLIDGLGIYGKAEISVNPDTGEETIYYGVEADYLTSRRQIIEASKETQSTFGTGGFSIGGNVVSIKGVKKCVSSSPISQ